MFSNKALIIVSLLIGAGASALIAWLLTDLVINLLEP